MFYIEGLVIELKSGTVRSCHDLLVQGAFTVDLNYRVRSSEYGGSAASPVTY